MPILDFPPRPNPELFSGQVVEARRFFFGPAQTGKASVVVGGGFERVDDDYAVIREKFPYVVVELVVGGRGSAILNGETYALTAGTLFTYAAEVPHQLQTSPGAPLTKYFIDLHGRRGQRLLKTLSIPPNGAWHAHRWLEMARLFDQIIDHGASDGRRRQAICDALLQALLLSVAQSISPQEKTSSALECYQRCRSLIENEARRLRSLDELAAKLNLDPAYVCRLFQRFDTVSPYQRLLHRRMSLAAGRLYGGSIPVKQVAKEFGYRDPFHFSRTFKAVIGIPPSAVK